jgi:nucleotide-binding universal stress UspA family protein
MEPSPSNANSRRETAGAARVSGLRRILVAVDDSEHATAVVREAVVLARSARATLCLYEAVEVPPEFPPAAATHTIDGLPAYLRGKAKTRLDVFARSAADLAPEIAIDESPNAGESIVRAARRYRADLIVIGSHKYGILERALGTTIAHVVQAADCDVLTVRDDAPFLKGRAGASAVVLACLDSSPAALLVYQAAARMAQARRLPLRALRVVTGAGELSTGHDALVAEAVRDLEGIARDAGLGPLAAGTAVVEEGVARAICRTANAIPDALVVVIRNCSRSVLIVRVPEPLGE